MKHFFPLIVLVAIFYGLLLLPIDGAVDRGGVSTSFGFLMLSAFFVGKIAERFRLPKITGYIACGILFGPFVLRLVDTEMVSRLRFIDGFALTFIALAAGGELKLKGLRTRVKTISLTILLQILLIYVGTVLIVFLLGPAFNLTPGDNLLITFSVGIICASVLTARSPATVMAVISEMRATGPFTETVMAVTVAMDVVVIILFSLSIALSDLFIMPGASLSPQIAVILTIQIGGAIAIGTLLGVGLILYIKYINRDLPIILLLLALIVTNFAHFFSSLISETWELGFYLEPLLISITTGFVVENFSPEGDALLKTIDEHSLPLYVIFFALAGASIKLTVVATAWPVAVLFVIYRLFALWMGSNISGELTGDPKPMNRWMGISYMAQAGVSIGLAVKISEVSPEWGTAIASIILMVIAINQILGPIALKIALEKIGEVGKRSALGFRVEKR
jgi:Kef-type K+ transport system membrane component KefB